MIPTPPPDFVADLQRYDPALRVRWGVRTQLWHLERRLPPRHRQLLAEKPNPWKSPKGLDRFDGWKDGYVLVMRVHPSRLHWRLVVEELTRWDAHLKGGMARLDDEIRRQEEQEEAQQDRYEDDWHRQHARDAADTMQWRLGHRVPTALSPVEVPPSDHVEQHEGFSVRISKRLSGVSA